MYVIINKREKNPLGTQLWTVVQFYQLIPHLFQDYSDIGQEKQEKRTNTLSFGDKQARQSRKTSSLLPISTDKKISTLLIKMHIKYKSTWLSESFSTSSVVSAGSKLWYLFFSADGSSLEFKFSSSTDSLKSFNSSFPSWSLASWVSNSLSFWCEQQIFGMSISYTLKKKITARIAVFAKYCITAIIRT